MKLSARNQLAGTVKEVALGTITAKVVIETSCGERITAIISRDAVEEIGLKIGDAATAVIKATEVMIIA